MLMRTWLVSGQTWVRRAQRGGDPSSGGRPPARTALPAHLPTPHLQDDDVIVTEGAELVAPGGVMADDLIDDVLEVQCELLHRQILALGEVGGRGW